MCVCCLQTKKRYAKEWAEAEKATQQAEKIESDLNATKIDVEKVNARTRLHQRLPSLTSTPSPRLPLLPPRVTPNVSPSFCILFCIVSPAFPKAKLHAHNRMHTAEECRNDYAAQLQKYNKEQNAYYYSQIPQIFNVRLRHAQTHTNTHSAPAGRNTPIV